MLVNRFVLIPFIAGDVRRSMGAAAQHGVDFVSRRNLRKLLQLLYLSRRTALQPAALSDLRDGHVFHLQVHFKAVALLNKGAEIPRPYLHSEAGCAILLSCYDFVAKNFPTFAR